MTPGWHRAEAEAACAAAKTNLQQFVAEAKTPAGANTGLVMLAHAQAALGQAHATLAQIEEEK